MKAEKFEELRKDVAEIAYILATPIDFDKLISEGLLKQIGTSYYTDKLHSLPENVSKKIKTITPTKKGLKLTFYKETKKMIKLAKNTEYLRDK